jgi:hypothetical protein
MAHAGVIGMPANDGTPRAWFSVLTPNDDDIVIEHHALEYDYSSAAAKMREHGLPEGYAAALETGLWPSCDILPAEELKVRGQPIEPGSVCWSVSVTQVEQFWASRITVLYRWPRCVCCYLQENNSGR